MPELTTIHLGLMALMLVVGVALGWVFRSDRSARDKIAITASWQEQIESRYSEQNRLAEQNKSLMEQVNQFQVTTREAVARSDELSNSLRESTDRSDELSDRLREACEIRDELQQQLKENDETLQATTVQRDRLRDAIENRESQVMHAKTQIKQKDDRIFRLSRDLDAWHNRLPPLVARFKARNQEALELASELALAREEIRRLKEMSEAIQSRIDPLDSEVQPDGMAASNEPHDATPPPFTAGPQYRIPGAGDAHAEDADNGVNDPNPVEREVRHNPFGLSDGNDDLKKIKGIGPAIEKKLNNLGVYRFNQIAEMSEYDIDRVAQQLKGFRSRIYREDWLGQARDLQYQKDQNLS